MDRERIAVIGAGTMGQGIAPVCATRGYQISLIDIVQKQLEWAQAAIRKSVETLHIMAVLHEGFGDDKSRSCPLPRRMVAAAHLGRKTGQGFYEYR